MSVRLLYSNEIAQDEQIPFGRLRSSINRLLLVETER